MSSQTFFDYAKYTKMKVISYHFDFRDNINMPTEFDKQEIVRQLFDMLYHFDV